MELFKIGRKKPLLHVYVSGEQVTVPKKNLTIPQQLPYAKAAAYVMTENATNFDV
jgi:hypothetical protein